MKDRHQPHYQPQQVLTALILTSILSLGFGSTLVDTATASTNSVPSNQHLTPSKQSRPRQLPPAVVNAVRRDASERTGTPRGQLKVVSSSQETWPDSCLGLAEPDELCGQALVEGWRVVITDGSQKWVYRTDSTGSIVRLEKDTSNTPSGRLPTSLANAVLKAASERTGLATSDLRIIKTEQMIADGCLGLGRPDEGCIQIAQTVWEVTVQARQQRLVYRIDSSGSQIRLNEAASDFGPGNTTLPKSIAEQVLQLASELLKLPLSQLEIKQAEPETWSNSCLDLQRPEERCRGVETEGWKVTVTAKEQRLVYHTNADGTIIRLNEAASRISNDFPDAFPIPENELPPPLDSKAVFRGITSGGIAGITYQITLMNDGRVIRTQLNSRNNPPAEQEMGRISRQQLRRFEQLLQRQKFSQFNGLQFPAPPGAADYFTVTLTSKEGTTRYADISQDQLPDSLQSVIQSWTQIVSR